MIKKIFSSKLLLILCVASCSSMLKGMELVLKTVGPAATKLLSSDFVKDNSHHLLKIGGGALVYGAYRLVLSRFDDLERLMNEVKSVAKKNGVKIDNVLNKFEGLSKKKQVEELKNLLTKSNLELKTRVENLDKKLDEQFGNIEEEQKKLGVELNGLKNQFSEFQNDQKKIGDNVQKVLENQKSNHGENKNFLQRITGY